MAESIIEGLKKKPYGLPLMIDAYLACVEHAISQPEARLSFKGQTGYDLESLIGRDPISKMIDKATGYEREVMLSFFDWVTVNIWGEEE